MLRGLFVAALASASPTLAQDGGSPLPAAVYAEMAQILIPGGNWEEGECFAVSDGGTSCAGAWLPEPTLIATGQRIARAEAEAESLKHEAPVMPKYLLIAAGVGLLVGIVFGGASVCCLTTGSPVCIPRR